MLAKEYVRIFHIFVNPTDYVNPNKKLEIDEIHGK